MMKRFISWAMIALSVTGCVHVIPKETLRKVDRNLSFAELLEAPKAHKGKVVLLGGVVVKAVNKDKGTLLEIYQTKIDSQGRPIGLDRSGGRFLAFYQGFLDSEIYCKGRKVTIVGAVEGEKVGKLGDLNYHYPYLVINTIHLWEKERPYVYRPYPWSFRDPWWGDPWDPWHRPHWRLRYRGR
jgi:outer membrane lipoprotein